MNNEVQLFYSGSEDIKTERINPARAEKQDEIIAGIGLLGTEENEEISILLEMLSTLRALASAKGILSDFRVTLLGGTVTTITTLSNITSIGSLSAVPMLQNMQNQSAVQSNINNVY